MRREEFLKIIDEIIPWEEWVRVIELYYSNGFILPPGVRYFEKLN